MATSYGSTNIHNNSNNISPVITANKSRREQFEEQLQDLQKDIIHLSQKLSVPAIITANRFGNGSNNSSTMFKHSNTSNLSFNESKTNISFQSQAVSTSSLQHHSENNGGNTDYQQRIESLSNDLTNTIKEKNQLSQQLQEAKNEMEEMKKGVVEYARLKAAFDHLKQDHEALKVSLESSERIRIQQKELINVLQKSSHLMSDNYSIPSFNSLSSISQRHDGESLVNQGEIPLENAASKKDSVRNPPPSAIDFGQHQSWLNLPINQSNQSKVPSANPVISRAISNRNPVITLNPTLTNKTLNKLPSGSNPSSPKSSRKIIPSPTTTRKSLQHNPNARINSKTAPKLTKNPTKPTVQANNIEEEAKKLLSESISKSIGLVNPTANGNSTFLGSVSGSYARLKDLFLQQQQQQQSQLQNGGVKQQSVYPVHHITQSAPFVVNPPNHTISKQPSFVKPPLYPVSSSTPAPGQAPQFPSNPSRDNEELNTSQEVGVNTDINGIQTNKKRKSSKKLKKKRSNSAPPALRWIMYRALPPPTTTTTFGKADRFV